MHTSKPLTSKGAHLIIDHFCAHTILTLSHYNILRMLKKADERCGERFKIFFLSATVSFNMPNMFY